MIITEPMSANDLKTLAQRMAEGRLPVADALRYAMLLAEALRRVHDTGKAHGAVTPVNMIVNGDGGLELVDAPEWALGAISPYTAPKVLQGKHPDERSDIFSFGAVMFELMTGRRAFEGDTRATLVANITGAPTPTSGSAAVDRLVGPCLVKDPGARTPRMQKLIMELKLVTVAARRLDPSAAPGLRRESLDAGALRTEIQQLEGRVATRLQSHERAVVELQRNANEAISSLRAQINSMTVELATMQSRGAAIAGGALDGAGSERIYSLERRVEEMRLHINQFERSVAADLVDIEQSLKVQGTAVESARTAMSQTDDLVERVVEALESLQSAMMDQGASSPERASFAVN